MTQWLAFANDIKIFDVVKCFQEQNICHWRKYNFSQGDIVYLYVKSLECVIYKTVVLSDKVTPDKWDDDKYWIDSSKNTDKEKRVLLQLLSVYTGYQLTLNHLKDNGLKRISSLTTPNKNPLSLLEYIKTKFDEEQNEFAGEMDINDENCDNSDNRWKKMLVNRYERDPVERLKCIKQYGNKYECLVCGMNFEKVYGELGRDFIHVHHIVPLSNEGKDDSINMIPICPNCHAMIHRHMSNGARDYEMVRSLLQSAKDK